MKFIKKFKRFVDMGFKTVAAFCKENEIENWTERQDGTVDVDGNASLYVDNMGKIPFKFGKITGIFNVSHKKFNSMMICYINSTKRIVEIIKKKCEK